MLRSLVGSGVHGIALEGRDDRDEMGVYFETETAVLASTVVGPKREDYTFRSADEGQRSKPGDLDLTLYSLRKYLSLAIKGNPTALLPLFAPSSDLVEVNVFGAQLRGLRYAFLSAEAVERFLGYMAAQRKNMMLDGRSRGVPYRPELVEQYGWDTKYGSHALRLAYQGHEIATKGTLTLPMPPNERANVLRVKRGELSRDATEAAILKLEEWTMQALTNGKLAVPAKPDRAKIAAWAVKAQKEFWAEPEGFWQ